MREYQKTYRPKNRDKLAEYKARYNAKPSSQEKRREQWRSYYAANLEKLRADGLRRAMRWASENPERARAREIRHKMRRRNAMPAWANQFFIEEAYNLARRRTKATGIKWHVDHVIPLQHAKVCGLHWEGNLRVITGSENQSKGNRWWPGMP